MSTSSKQGFVEYFRRNILCSPGRHIVAADHVTLSCDREATDTGEDEWSEADCHFYKDACEWDKWVKQRFIENNWYVHNL